MGDLLIGPPHWFPPVEPLTQEREQELMELFRRMARKNATRTGAEEQSLRAGIEKVDDWASVSEEP